MTAIAMRWAALILVVFASATCAKGGGGGGHSSGGGGHASSGGSHASVAKSAPAAPARVAPPITRPYIGWFPFFGNTGSTEEQRRKKEAKEKST